MMMMMMMVVDARVQDASKVNFMGVDRCLMLGVLIVLILSKLVPSMGAEERAIFPRELAARGRRHWPLPSRPPRTDARGNT
jgi:hypothetical protein